LPGRVLLLCLPALAKVRAGFITPRGIRRVTAGSARQVVSLRPPGGPKTRFRAQPSTVAWGRERGAHTPDLTDAPVFLFLAFLTFRPPGCSRLVLVKLAPSRREAVERRNVSKTFHVKHFQSRWRGCLRRSSQSATIFRMSQDVARSSRSAILSSASFVAAGNLMLMTTDGGLGLRMAELLSRQGLFASLSL
jgi:hypothetical protein